MYTVGSFFAGVGGIDLGLEQTGQFQTVYANEWDPYPVQAYEKNFSLSVDVRDIHEVSGKEIPDFKIMAGGFPCQAFSIAGYQQGFDDKKGRGNLFFELVRILKEKQEMNKQPEVVFFENVKNLVSHDHGNTLKVILSCLHDLGYHVTYRVLNATEYGNLPQNRERVYLIGFLNKNAFDKFKWPEKEQRICELSDFLNFTTKEEDSYYYTKENCPFFSQLNKEVKKEDTVYQWRRTYVRENKSHVCPTLTASMGMGGHQVPIIHTKYGIRRLTPRECFSLQGFPTSFQLPEVSKTRLYKMIGNSVCVPVIQQIGKQIVCAIKK